MAQVSTRPAERAAAQRRPRVRWGQIATIVGFLLPAAAIYIWLVLLPVIQAIYYSFYRWNGLGPLQSFIGLANYTKAFTDRVFIGALANNLQIVVLSLVVQLPIALGLALLVRHNLRGRAVFRMVFFLPFVLSQVVTGVIWNFIYVPQGGMINALYQAIFPGGTSPAFLANPSTVLYALFVVITWKFFGFHMILYTAGLQNIPAELEEAAQIDGCNRLQYDGDLPVQVRVPELPARLRQRDRGDYLRYLLRVFHNLPARSDAARFCIGRREGCI